MTRAQQHILQTTARALQNNRNQRFNSNGTYDQFVVVFECPDDDKRKNACLALIGNFSQYCHTFSMVTQDGCRFYCFLWTSVICLIIELSIVIYFVCVHGHAVQRLVCCTPQLATVSCSEFLCVSVLCFSSSPLPGRKFCKTHLVTQPVIDELYQNWCNLVSIAFQISFIFVFNVFMRQPQRNSQTAYE